MNTQRAHLHLAPSSGIRIDRLWDKASRFKLKRDDGMVMDFICQFGHWSHEWHMMLRRPVK
jgi:hypothetical protein